MAESFAVVTINPKINLSKNESGKPQTGNATFVVTNKTTVAVKGRIKLLPLGSLKLEWLSVDQKNVERQFAPNETHNIIVNVNVPPMTSPGMYQFRLDVFSEENPEDDYTEGQIVEFEVTPIIVKKVNWFLPVIIIVAIVMSLIVIFVIVTTPKKIKVPAITGISYRQAADSLSKIGLLDSIVPGLLPVDTNDWIVQDQQPASGARVEKKIKIALTMQPGVEVPNVIGQAEAAGKSVLESKGFTAIKIGERDIGGAVGTIVETQPVAGIIAKKGDQIQYLIRRPPVVDVTEDCIGFRTESLEIRAEGTVFLLTDGSSRMKLFPNRPEAERALKIIHLYGINKHCFVGRPDPALEYWLNGDQGPQGEIENEDCISFNPDNLSIRPFGTLFLLVDGSHSLVSFPNVNEAETARKIILKYRFNQFCFVGRPDPSMTYFRR